MSGHDKIFETKSKQQVSRIERQLQRQEQGESEEAAKLLEERLNTKVFYLACRHHILEVLVGAVWEKLFGKVKSPENPEKKRDCEEILHDILTSEKPPRADYKKMAELTVIALGGTLSRGIHWSRPGTIHQTRWMARNLYSMKMLVFCDQLEYDEETVAKMERLNIFLALFYTPLWMISTSAVDPPVNDFQLIQGMLRYKRSDPEVAEAVVQKMENHKWYLTLESVPFALFISRLSDKQKQDIAAQLHATEKPDSFRRGKPVFQNVQAITTIVDPIEKEDYKKALEHVRNLRVVNDIVERGVKMMSDFANVITTDPKQREYLIHAVEYNRRRFESIKKQTLNK
ncbi:hypothetical protein O3P69_014328 [Scylla paramamosain]|uniref:Uncharacterized protein n=1 Tax=Scylla paramamosain TaxID=85552 RepID=A0AAW0TCR3_SCYPA